MFQTKSGLHWFVHPQTEPDQIIVPEFSRPSLVCIGLARPGANQKKIISECSKQSLADPKKNQTKLKSRGVPDKVWFALVSSVPKKAELIPSSRVFQTKPELHWFVLSQRNPDQTTDQECSK
uniref:Uncharacterized protein n=1 Tax=Timema shepardi TaxID=629360 RepID=A0A7R9BA81_TIMSH|nr:unnamed protein product [Timema shepardi]